jgi:UDPglucose 6-dehydrogenase
MKEICVVGVGYVGLVTAACFADLGNRVAAVDVSHERIEGLKRASCSSTSRVSRSWWPGIRGARLLFTTSTPMP